MGEPIYIRQSGDELTEAEANQWFAVAAQEARIEGTTWFRASVHPTIPNLRLMEAWLERPDDDGEQRWALAFAPETPSLPSDHGSEVGIGQGQDAGQAQRITNENSASRQSKGMGNG